MPKVALPSGFTSLRYEQEMALGQILDHFKNGAEVVTLDAPPGVGKTLIGEVARMELDRRGIYLCTTKALQDQFQRDFPYAALLKGRANYPTQRFPERFQSRWDPLSAADCTWTQADPECQWCDSKQVCAYEIAKRTALEEAVLVNANTAYYLTESRWVGRLADGFDFVVLDEAGLLEDALLNQVEVRITQGQMRAMGIPWPSKKTVEAAWVDWFRWTIDLLEKREKQVKGSDVKAEKDRLRLRRLRQQLLFAVEGVVDGGWVYQGYMQGFIQFVPVMVEAFGEAFFWSKAGQVLAMDGTMGNGLAWAADVGASSRRVATVECDSPFPIENREIRYAPVTKMTWADRAEAWPLMAKGIRAVMDLHPGERILVHTVSGMLANWLFQELADSGRVNYYIDSSDKQVAVQWFEETEGAVLLAPSMERGYDGKDDKCRVVVVAKMPYPPTDDKRVSKYLYASGAGGRRWYARKTAESLMQMTGRGTRHQTDWSVNYILDGSFVRLYREYPEVLSNWWKQALMWNGPWRGEIDKRMAS